MAESEQFDLLYNQALRYLAYRPRAKKEIHDYLVKKIKRKQRKISEGEKLIKAVFKKLKEQNLVNDQAFAIWWCEQRVKFRPRSSRVLLLELRQKGVATDLAKRIISQVVDEKKSVEKLFRKKKNLWEKLPPQKRRQKAIRYFSSRGFSWPIVEQVIDSSFKKE